MFNSIFQKYFIRLFQNNCSEEKKCEKKEQFVVCGLLQLIVTLWIRSYSLYRWKNWDWMTIMLNAFGYNSGKTFLKKSEFCFIKNFFWKTEISFKSENPTFSIMKHLFWLLLMISSCQKGLWHKDFCICF